MTPTARTLAECRKRGWTADVVERHVRSFITKDFLGCIDVIALTPDGFLGIQATSNSGGNHSARVAKIQAEPRAREFVRAGGRIEVWSFAKRGPRGKAKRWTLRVEPVAFQEAA